MIKVMSLMKRKDGMASPSSGNGCSTSMSLSPATCRA